MTKPLLCNVCNKEHHYTWLGSWNEYNWEKRPMGSHNFVCLSCIASPKTRKKAYQICGWSDE